jgi:Gpi18-like mannosyltransferase
MRDVAERPRPSNKRALIALFAIALGVRLALTPLYAHLPNGTLDEGFWKNWMERIHQHGVLNIFRTSDTDYVGYHWILWPLATIYGWIGGPYTQTTPSLHILVKMPSILYDLVLIAAVYRVTLVVVQNQAPEREGSDGTPERCALAAATICAFHPAILYDSAVWAQVDAAISAAMLVSLVLAFYGRPAWAGFVFGLGFSIKPHPIILVPLLGLILWRKGRLQAIERFFVVASSTVLLILVPWLIHGDGNRIRDVYVTLFTKQRERLSELAWNIWWIPDQLGDPRPGSTAFGWFDVLTYQRLAFALSACATILAITYALRHSDIVSMLVAAAYQAFAFYELPVGSHERYLYPLFVLLLPVLFVRPRWLLLYVPISVTFFMNLVVVAPPMQRYMDHYVYGDIGVDVAAIQAVFFVVFTLVLLYGATRLQRDGSRRDLPPQSLLGTRDSNDAPRGMGLSS